MAVTIKGTKISMQKLGIYRPEFDPIITLFVGLNKQYNSLLKDFDFTSKKVIEVTADGGAKKSPVVAILENLRKDILTYSAQLGLTPAGLKRINEVELQGTKKKNKLERALESFNGS